VIPFSRDGDVVTARLVPGEAAVLSSLAAQLIVMLEERAAESPATESPSGLLLAQLGIGGASAPPLDPALARLLPDAYRGDDHAASEHRQLTELGLVDRKVANARTVIASLDDGTTVTLDPAAVQAWLRHLTDLRLVIAARLQIKDDGDEATGDDRMLDLYDWLGYLQGTLVECLE